MLREVGKIYSRSFQMIFQYPLFLVWSAVYFAFNRITTWLDKSLPPIVALVFSFVGLYIIFAVPLLFILMVYQTENMIDAKDILQKTRITFWRFVGQSLAGFLLTLAYTLPASCLVLFSVFSDNTVFALVLVPLWLFVTGYLGFGSISFGRCILLDNGEGVFKNSLYGLRILNGNFPFFITLNLINTLASLVLMLFRYEMGSLATGVDLFSVPISNFPLFMQNITAATQTPVIFIWDFIVWIITIPFFTILPTLAYLRFRNYDTSSSSRR